MTVLKVAVQLSASGRIAYRGDSFGIHPRVVEGYPNVMSSWCMIRSHPIASIICIFSHHLSSCSARASAGIHNLSISSNGHVSKQKLTLSRRMADARSQVITLRNRAEELNLACGHHLYKRFASHQRSNARLVTIAPFRSTDPEYASSCSAEASRIPVYTVT